MGSKASWKKARRRVRSLAAPSVSAERAGKVKAGLQISKAQDANSPLLHELVHSTSTKQS